MCPVKVHGAGKPEVFLMFPLLLGYAQLIPLQIEKYGTDTSGACIKSH